MERALIIEPDESIRRLQRMILRQHAGAETIVERLTIGDAMEVFRAEHFDFTMADISRPCDDLREFLHLSRHRQKTPVIAFTSARVSRETLALVVNDHVFAVFPKPFELGQLVDAVRAAREAEKAGKLYPKFFGFLQKLHSA